MIVFMKQKVFMPTTKVLSCCGGDYYRLRGWNYKCNTKRNFAELCILCSLIGKIRKSVLTRRASFVARRESWKVFERGKKLKKKLKSHLLNRGQIKFTFIAFCNLFRRSHLLKLEENLFANIFMWKFWHDCFLIVQNQESHNFSRLGWIQ